MPDGIVPIVDPRDEAFKPSPLIIGAVEHAQGMRGHFVEAQPGALQNQVAVAALGSAAVADRMILPALERIEARLNNFAAREKPPEETLAQSLARQAPDHIGNGLDR
jgi:predicted component of type VI protein secretion system